MKTFAQLLSLFMVVTGISLFFGLCLSSFWAFLICEFILGGYWLSDYLEESK